MSSRPDVIQHSKGQILAELARVLAVGEGLSSLEPSLCWGYLLVVAQVSVACGRGVQRPLAFPSRLWELLQAFCPDDCHVRIRRLRVDISGYDSGQRLTEKLNDLQLVLMQLTLKDLRLQRADLPQKRSNHETWGDSTPLGGDEDGAVSRSGLCVVGSAMRHIC